MEGTAAKGRIGIVGYLLRITSETIVVAIISMFFSIVLVILGMAFFDQDVNRTFDMVAKEKEYLGLYAEKNVLFRNADRVVYSWLNNINNMLAAYGGNLIIEVWRDSTEYVLAIVNTINVFLLRVFVMIFSMPVYLVFGVIGLTRGLVGRELRKWGGGHETGSLFHLYLNLIKNAFVGSWIVYLSWPTSLNPNIVVLPSAMFFGFTVMATAHRIKKYL